MDIGAILENLNIIDMILDGLTALTFLGDVIFVIILVIALLKGLKGTPKMIIKIIFSILGVVLAFSLSGKLADYILFNMLEDSGKKLILLNETTLTYAEYFSISDYLTAVFTAGGATVSEITPLMSLLAKNFSFIILLPLSLIAMSIVNAIFTFVLFLLLPRGFKKRLKNLKLRVVSIPLSMISALVLIIIISKAFNNIELALSDIPAAPDAISSIFRPQFADIMSMFTATNSFILRFINSILPFTKNIGYFNSYVADGTKVVFTSRLNEILIAASSVTNF